MNIVEKKENGTLVVLLEGRLYTTTAPTLEKTLSEGLDGMQELVLDMQDLSYLSSAGLRVLLAAQKRMNKQGKMVVRNVNSTIMDVLEITGFVNLLTIEK